MCRERLTEEQYEDFMMLYEEVFSAVATPFHWKNGGVFKTEVREPIDVDDIPDDGIEFLPHHGLFQHHVQLEAHRTQPTATSLCINQLVAVVLKSVTTALEDVPPITSGFRMGRIVAVDRLTGLFDVVWLTTKSKTFGPSSSWRPWISRGSTRVSVEECVYTFRSLTSGSKMRKAEYEVLNYAMEQREAEKTRAEIAKGVLAGKAIPLVDPSKLSFDISDYLEDHQQRDTEKRSTKPKKKKQRKRKAKVANGYAADTDASASSSVSDLSLSTSSSAQVHAVCAGVYTARWFDDK